MTARGAVLAALVGLSFLLVPACRPVNRLRKAADAPVDPNAGRAIYLRACASCHGEDGRGGGPAGGTLPAPTDLTRLSQNHGGTFPRDYVIDVITGERGVESHGTREMPVWRERFGPSGSGAAAVASFYAQRQLEELVAYLKTLQRPAGE